MTAGSADHFKPLTRGKTTDTVRRVVAACTAADAVSSAYDVPRGVFSTCFPVEPNALRFDKRPDAPPSDAPPCPKCGYDLTGLPRDGRCPECGEPFDKERLAERADTLSARHAQMDRRLTQTRTAVLGLVTALLFVVSLAGLAAQGGSAVYGVALVVGCVMALATLTSYVYQRPK